jgi:hypothetical protein
MRAKRRRVGCGVGEEWTGGERHQRATSAWWTKAAVAWKGIKDIKSREVADGSRQAEAQVCEGGGLGFNPNCLATYTPPPPLPPPREPDRVRPHGPWAGLCWQARSVSRGLDPVGPAPGRHGLVLLYFFSNFNLSFFIL